MRRIRSFLAMDILEASLTLGTQGHSVISLALGEPDLDPPKIAIQALQKALARKVTKYTHSQGTLELRQAITEHYRKKYGVRISPERVVVTPGTSPAMLIALGALLEVRDEVLLSDLHYPCYPNFLYFLGAKPRFIKTQSKNGFHFTPEQARQALRPKTKALWITSPSNPTGHVLSANTLAQFAKLKKFMISDEIYHGLTYEAKEHSILEFTDQAFVFNGFSKAYAMTGFRLGYVIVPDAFIEPIRKLQQSFYISTNSFVQAAGLAVLQKGAVAQRHIRKIFMQRRKVILSELAALGMKAAVAPQGAFYVLVDVRKWTNDSYKFAFDLLKQAHVAVTPGIDFGKAGLGYIRFSYANSITNIKEAFKRIGKFLLTNRRT
ncbi:MAG: pyridoxal phosphate-dependent aminotransferase [Deltaproteobacteria bacterium]|nr:pyridoxal phosphate-dependent aminotransferase [Deltaproteobacteria bacterium]